MLDLIGAFFAMILVLLVGFLIVISPMLGCMILVEGYELIKKRLTRDKRTD